MNKLSLIQGGKRGPQNGDLSKVNNTMKPVVKIIRLISGEELIASVVIQNDKKYVVDRALSLVHKPNGDGQVALGFGPFLPYADGQIAISVTAIAATADPIDKLVEEYERIFSPIIQPSSGIVGPSDPLGPVGPSLVQP